LASGKRRQKNEGGFALNSAVRTEIFGILTAAFAVILLFGLYHPSMGVIGELLARLLRMGLGRAAWTIPAVILGAGVMIAVTGDVRAAQPRIVGVALGAVMLATVHHAIGGFSDLFSPPAIEGGGGYVGASVGWLLTSAVGRVGSYIILAAGALVSIALTLNVPLTDLLRRGGRAAYKCSSDTWCFLAEFVSGDDGEGEWKQPAVEDSAHQARGGGKEQDSDDAPDVTPPIRSYCGEDDNSRAAGNTDRPDAKKSDPGPQMPKNDSETSPESAEQMRMDLQSAYTLPDPGLLEAGERRKSFRGRARADLNRKARKLESTMASFGIKVSVTEISHGPTITRFDVHPSPGVKVSQIVRLADDLALALASSGVRVVAPVPGKSAVGIEVPNQEVTPVLLREIVESSEFARAPGPLTLGFGADITGKPLVRPLDDLLHLLIAGSTGSGKSICIRCIIASILFKARPDEVKFLLIDPKVVEFMSYNELPHLLSPVVTDPRKAAGCLTWAVKEMERRYNQFAEHGVRDLPSYNAHAAETGAEPMPRIVIIIDELADMMNVARVDVEDAIQRLAQMARAAGIHLIVATQRPSVDVITGVIKANIPSRIAFSVSSGADSRTILDTGGAERLVGDGDMLFSPVGRDKLLRAQGSFLSDDDLQKLLAYVRQQASPQYQEEVVQAAEEAEAEGGNGKQHDDDKLEEAISIVLESGEASVSMLQRRLRVGYTRAGRLIDTMESMGIIGPHRGPKSREVLLSRAAYQQQNESGEDEESDGA